MVQERPLHKNKWMKQSVNANWLEVFKQEKSHETKKQWILTPDGILLSPKKKKKKESGNKKRNKTKHDHGVPAYTRQFFCMQLVS